MAKDSNRKWQIFEMLNGNHDLNCSVIRTAKKIDLVEAIIEYICKRGKRGVQDRSNVIF